MARAVRRAPALVDELAQHRRGAGAVARARAADAQVEPRRRALRRWRLQMRVVESVNEKCWW